LLTIETKRLIAVLFYKEGKSKREIASNLGIHRNTVTKYIDEIREEVHLSKEDNIKNIDDIVDVLIEPAYNSDNNRYKVKLTVEFISYVEERWKESKEKNRMKLYLENRGYKERYVKGKITIVDCKVSYSTFCKAIEIIEKRSNKFTKSKS
jgi:predicted transcriptional regulator